MKLLTTLLIVPFGLGIFLFPLFIFDVALLSAAMSGFGHSVARSPDYRFVFSASVLVDSVCVILVYSIVRGYRWALIANLVLLLLLDAAFIVNNYERIAPYGRWSISAASTVSATRMAFIL